MYYTSDESARILFEEAQKMGLYPEWLTDYGLFSIKVEGNIHYIFYSNSILNNQLSYYLARNKHITRVLIEKNHLPNIPFLLPQSKEEVYQFLDHHKVIIAKPTMGSRSQDIHLIEHKKEIDSSNIFEYIFEKYIKGKEMRYLVLNNQVIGVLEKVYDTPINDPNVVERTSFSRDQWDTNLVEISLSIMNILGLKFGAVDFLIDRDNKNYILEVNSAPALRRFDKPTSGPSVNASRQLLEATIKKSKRIHK